MEHYFLTVVSIQWNAWRPIQYNANIFIHTNINAECEFVTINKNGTEISFNIIFLYYLAFKKSAKRHTCYIAK